MTLMLELAPELEARLRRRAIQDGEDEQSVALRLLSGTLIEEEEWEASIDTGRSMADLFAGRVGLVCGSGEAYSENGGRRYAAHLAQKHVQNREQG